MSCAAHDLAATRRLLTHGDVDDIQMLAMLAAPQGSPIVVDLGAGSGTTALAVLCARNMAHVFTFDHDAVNLDSTREAVYNMNFQDRWASRLCKSWEGIDFMSERVDLLLVDASHEYEDIKRDLEAWLPLVRASGFVWLHDYTPMIGVSTAEYPGVAQAIEEFLGDKTPIELKGIGWACRL